MIIVHLYEARMKCMEMPGGYGAGSFRSPNLLDKVGFGSRRRSENNEIALRAVMRMMKKDALIRPGTAAGTSGPNSWYICPVPVNAHPDNKSTGTGFSSTLLPDTTSIYIPGAVRLKDMLRQGSRSSFFC
jgi:hypothetical protein